MVMLIWMTLRVRAMARFQTDVSEVFMLNNAPARWVIYELDRVETVPVTFPRTFTMFDLTILRQYAKKFETSPSSLPPTLLLSNTETSLTFFDKYPKAIYHFLVVPRILTDSVFTAKDLTNLHTPLTKGPKAESKKLIEGLKRDAEVAKGMVEKEMLEKHGYKWDVWIGFHAVPTLACVRELWQQQCHYQKNPFSYRTMHSHRSVTCICTSSLRICARRA